nr:MULTISPECIES: BCCT family transporter [unclassified Massilia]
MGALQINSGLNAVFGIPTTALAQVIIIVVTTALFVTSAVSGVDSGIRILSNFNMLLAVALGRHLDRVRCRRRPTSSRCRSRW